MSNSVEQSREQSAQIKGEIAESLVQLQFQDRVSQILAQVTTAMQQFCEPAEAVAAGVSRNDRGPGARRLEKMAEYVHHGRTAPQSSGTGGQDDRTAGSHFFLTRPLPLQERFMAKKILLVDDSASVRKVAGIALASAGYEVLEACNGQDALGKLNGDKIHLIISDVNMPVMDGITFLKEVKQQPSYRFTPSSC